MKVKMNLRVVVVAIIAIVIIIGLSEGNIQAQKKPARETADIILYNGKVITVDKDFSIAEALVIGGETLLAIGTNKEILRFAGPNTKMVDLKGKTVVPGFIDAHQHTSAVGWVHPTFRGCKTIADVVRVVENEVKNKKPGEWVIIGRAGGAPSPSRLPGVLQEKKMPTSRDLDPISPNNPVWLSGGHVNVFNSYALARAGITKDTPNPVGGTIGKDPATGELTGIMSDNAIKMVSKLAPRMTYKDMVTAIRKGIEYMNSNGITSCRSEGMPSDGLRALLELRSKKLLTIRVSSSIPDPDLTKPIGEIEAYLKSYEGNMASYAGIGDILLRIEGGGEFGIDGGTNSGSAFQRFNYVGPTGKSYSGDQKVTQEKFTQISLLCAKNNFRMNVHASGGAALDLTLNAWEEVNKQIPITERRWGIHHAQAPSKRNFEQIKRLGVVVEIDWIKMGSGVLEYYPKEFCENLNPLRNWLDNGVRIATGSDSDAGDPNPIAWIYMAATKILWVDGTLIGPHQKITAKEALIASTINGAYVTFEEDIKGSIEEGKLADLVVLSDDILSVPVDEIKNIKVLMTILGGKIVYDRQ